MAQNPALVMQSQGEQIRALYGGGDEEGAHGRRSSGQPGLGPFSLQSYLAHMLKEDSWGDQVVLHSISMMFQIRLSLINADGLYCLSFKHRGGLSDADAVVVYNGESHFMGTGNYNF
jgi:hypothetical protein